jgi:hypothetical protein
MPEKTPPPSAPADLPARTRSATPDDFKNDLDGLDKTCADMLGCLSSSIGSVSHRKGNFAMSEGPVEIFRQTWGEMIHLGKMIPASSAEHDRFVTMVGTIRQWDVLLQYGQSSLPSSAGNAVGGPEEGEAAAAAARGPRPPWAEFPFLAQDFHDHWVQESAGYTAEQRESLAVMTAKLCGTGIQPAQLGVCALWLFKETFEKEQDASFIAALLLACRAWMRYAKHALVKMAAANVDILSSDAFRFDQTSVSPGDLALAAGIKRGGFHIDRWLFWRRRLAEMAKSKDEPTVELARDCFYEMIYAGANVGIEVAGEEKFLHNFHDGMDRALAAKGQRYGSLELSEVRWEPSWADKE